MSIVVAPDVALEEVKGWLVRLGAEPPPADSQPATLAAGIAKAISEGRVTISGETLTYKSSHPMAQTIVLGMPTGKVLLAAARGETMLEQACRAVAAWGGVLANHLEELPIREFEEVAALWTLFQLSRC